MVKKIVTTFFPDIYVPVYENQKKGRITLQRVGRFRGGTVELITGEVILKKDLVQYCRRVYGTGQGQTLDVHSSGTTQGVKWQTST